MQQRRRRKERAKAKGKAKGKAKAKARAGRNDDQESRSLDPSLNLADPEHARESATNLILGCLEKCQAAGTLGCKGRHSHEYRPIEMGTDLQLCIYWSRNAAAVKRKKDDVHIGYFSRTTPCNGTNIILMEHWVLLVSNLCDPIFCLGLIL